MAKSIGLDIGSQNIRVVELERGKFGGGLIRSKKPGWLLTAYGLLQSPLQMPIYSNAEEKKELASRIKQLFKEAKITKKEVNLALPEPQVFTQIIETPLLSAKELKSAMQWQAEQYIPLPLEETSFDYLVLERHKEQNKMRVLVSAAPLTLINKLTQLLAEAGLTIESVETQILSVIRALARSVPEKATATLINLGHNSSDFAFITQFTILFTRSIPIGGGALTRAISQEFNFNLEQAERYKITYGIDPQQLEGKVYQAVKPLLNQFLSELNRGFVYFKEQFPQRKIDLILITGGGSLMPGIVRFMTESFGIETQRGEPFAGFNFKNNVQPPSSGASDYAVATGLAMR